MLNSFTDDSSFTLADAEELTFQDIHWLSDEAIVLELLTAADLIRDGSYRVFKVRSTLFMWEV